MAGKCLAELLVITAYGKAQDNASRVTTIGRGFDLPNGLRVRQRLPGIRVNISSQSGAHSVQSRFVGHVEPEEKNQWRIVEGAGPACMVTERSEDCPKVCATQGCGIIL